MYGRDDSATLNRRCELTTSLPQVSIWNYGFSQRFSSLLGATPAGQVHPALVWRDGGGVDYVYVVFSSAAVRRLCVRAFPEQPLGVARTRVAALRSRIEFTPLFRVPGGCMEFADHPGL